MKNKLQDKLMLFAENVDSMRSDFIWKEAAAKRLVALIYALNGKKVDNGAIKHCYDLIKGAVGVFSSFRGNLSVYVAAALSLTEQPEQLLADTLHVYDLLKDEKFWSGDFLVVTAFEIAVNSKRTDYAKTAKRTKEFYDEMKANHRFHIGQDDYIFAALMALTEIEPHQGAVKMKCLFQRLKSEFSRFIGGGSVLTLSQMLVLGGSTDECVVNLLHLNRSLRNQKIRLDKTYTLPSLAVLAMLDGEHNALAEGIIEARDFLRTQKGLGRFTVSTQELLLYVVSIITHVYAGDIESDLMKAGITNGVTNLIIAQQVAIIVSITVTSSVVTASASC